jgi:hypothetical protein
MDRIPHRDKQPEGTAKPTGKAKKAGPPPWETHAYEFQQQQLAEDLDVPHSNPRFDLALQNLSLHQGDFMPYESDGDHGCGYPAFGLGTTSDLNASASFAGELGALAGGPGYSKFYQDYKEGRARAKAEEAKRARRNENHTYFSFPRYDESKRNRVYNK